jgi:serine/threonine-protein kinase
LTGFNAINQLGTELVAVQEQVSKTVALGTLGYMAMEQVRGRPRPSSDIYSLGMIGIQALTGLNPMQLEEDPQTGEIVWQHQAMVSEELAAILTEMVRYHFKDRYHSANDVLKTLQPLVQANASRQLAVPSEPPALSTPLSPTALVFETETIAETAIDPTAPEAVQISEPLASLSLSKSVIS